MPDLWDDEAARAFVAEFGDAGEDLALRVYTSRLLGRDPALVLHGGGNTSVKTTQRDLIGRSVEVLCVKGSGWDLAAIEPPGLPAVRLDALRELRQLHKSLSGSMADHDDLTRTLRLQNNALRHKLDKEKEMAAARKKRSVKGAPRGLP